jgi:hypothetical protein
MSSLTGGRGIALAFDESQHPRGKKGTRAGGKFVSKEGDGEHGPKGAHQSLTGGHRTAVSDGHSSYSTIENAREAIDAQLENGHISDAEYERRLTKVKAHHKEIVSGEKNALHRDADERAEKVAPKKKAVSDGKFGYTSVEEGRKHLDSQHDNGDIDTKTYMKRLAYLEKQHKLNK